MKETYIVIPALNPDIKLLNLVKDIRDSFECRIICVNDGSDENSKYIFDALKEKSVIVLEHEYNKGKGRALKTAFEFIATEDIDSVVVTVDADGQHDISSIKKCVNAVENEEELVLGARDLATSNTVPLRSRFGNTFTRYVTRIVFGIKLSDTQTGLRAFSSFMLPYMLSVNGERYEYEMNMIIGCRNNSIKIVEVPINTIYENENKSSHFRPIMDSIRIYFTFLKYILSSISSAVVEYLLFLLLVYKTNNIFISTYVARFVSSVFNYTINKNVVFKSAQNTVVSVIKYYLLVIMSATLSAFVVNYLVSLLGNGVEWIKIVVDSAIFILNYIIQRRWIFK